MARRNQLILIALASSALGGCGALAPRQEAATSPAPVETAHVGAPSPAPAPQAAGPAQDADLLFQALAAAGINYHPGGKSYQTGFDCSGLVAFVYREAYGLALPHNTRAQSELGEAIDAQALRPGDLVFFNTQHRPFSHVGIYVGNGKFIHAPKQGSVVRTESLHVRYWATRFDGARRIEPFAVNAGFTGKPKRPLVTYP